MLAGISPSSLGGNIIMLNISGLQIPTISNSQDRRPMTMGHECDQFAGNSYKYCM
jgi:hypothetical protein